MFEYQTFNQRYKVFWNYVLNVINSDLKKKLSHVVSLFSDYTCFVTFTMRQKLVENELCNYGKMLVKYFPQKIMYLKLNKRLWHLN